VLEIAMATIGAAGSAAAILIAGRYSQKGPISGL
jgi:hypothetical protein